jgi:hypothetical protein
VNKYWLIAFLIWSVALLSGGFEIRGWYDDKTLLKATDAHLESVETVIPKTAVFNQNIEKAKANVKTKDNCISKPIDAGVLLLLK